MVVGADVLIGEILKLMGSMTIDRFCGKTMCPKSLVKWLDEKWMDVLGYKPSFNTLTRGWISFKFRTKEDLEEIFRRMWGWESLGHVIK